ncbi:3-deoxy-manno-octulosonate cytidylyltransferase [Aurantimonas sp. MSK8Z-1]|uniref:3-deoxy-manno-octulosonate cytidylyltransferase n=1 Tax=Mangrovibrevibacter kandeliae TaxID=2968473 RepID=UPI00211740E3|nr:3-deoxy-manno-octulosonate cytidylyltransferase [Aurantimonas sp. MSK8Z-1]MCW4114847.1 3-deoxy-manno-octulosonate cytidylyltransferase [Aurantimonas sp. MSK8Z-1]
MTMISSAVLRDDPRGFFGRFDALVLVANSAEVASAVREEHFGERPLFVFFNKAFRVLDAPFQRDCLLVSRSSPVGSSLIYRGELGAVLKLLDTPHFHGIINFRAGAEELLSLPEDFGRPDVANLDLTEALDRIYPKGRLPSTGFAMVTWLAGLDLGVPIHLLGFSGVRQDVWRVYDVHDWSWEQTVLKLLAGRGIIVENRAGGSGAWPIDALVAQFPQFDRQSVESMAIEVLSARLSAANRSIDQLFSTVKLQIALSKLLRSLRPKSRKVRAREKLKKRIDAQNAG